MTFGVPYCHADNAHYDHLVEVEPALHEHRAEQIHYMFVIESTYRTHDGRSSYAPDPSVALEIYVFLLSGSAHYIYGKDGEQHSGPLVDVESFFEHHHCTHQD